MMKGAIQYIAAISTVAVVSSVFLGCGSEDAAPTKPLEEASPSVQRPVEEPPSTPRGDVESPATQPSEGMEYVDNGVIRVGVNLQKGGSITHISEKANGRNIVNSYGCGRQIQMSYRSGPMPFAVGEKKPSAQRKNVGWNPTRAVCPRGASDRSTFEIWPHDRPISRIARRSSRRAAFGSFRTSLLRLHLKVMHSSRRTRA